MIPAISIKNIGPIVSLSLPVPPDGGVVTLTGPNGSGKTTALAAISAAISGRGKPPLRDLAERGEVVAAGVKLTVGRSVRRAGELEVTTLEGRLSVADLVDPGIADPARADATRIKALVGLSGVGLSRDDLGGFPPDMLDGLDLADPVAAMAELKRRLDIGGREYEKLAKAEGGRAAAMIEQAGDDGDAPSVESAMAALTEAQRRLDRLVAEKSDAVAAKARAKEARERLERVPAADVAAAEAEVLSRTASADALREEAQALKAKYNAAVEAFKAEQALLDVALERFTAARQTALLRDQIERQLAESTPPEPSDADLAEADADLSAKRAALSAAERARQAVELRRHGAEKSAEADRLAAEALALRRQAKQTDEVLSEIVADLPSCPLRVADGRLAIDTARGPTLFGELSHGERWRVALDIAIGAVGAGGLLVIPQEAWEGLDNRNRAVVAERAKAGKVVVLTAECGDGELAGAVMAAGAPE